MNTHFTPHILQVCLSPYWGGMEKFCLDLSSQLNQKYTTSILVRKNSHLEEKTKKTALKVFSLNFVNYIDLIAIIKIRNLILKNKIDVIHFHGSSEMGLLTPALFRLPKVKLINHKHIYINSNKKNLYHRLIYRRADTIIALSNNLKKNILEKYPVQENIVTVLPNAIDHKKFTLGKTSSHVLSKFQSKKKGVHFITTVGRLVKGKGLKYFIQIANHIIKNNKNIFFFIVGSGSDEIREELNSLIETENKKNIIFTGYQENIPEVLRETDLFLFFSEGEAFPLVVLEAMMMQKKILATNVRGTADILKPYSTECLIEKNEKISVVSEKILKKLSPENKQINYKTDQYFFDHYLPLLLKVYGH